MKIIDAIEHYRNNNINITEPLLTLLDFAKKHAKKTVWVNVYIDTKTLKTWIGTKYESQSIALSSNLTINEDSKYVGTIEVEYYVEN